MWWVWSRPPQFWHEYRFYNTNIQRRPRSKSLQNKVFQLKLGVLSTKIFTSLKLAILSANIFTLLHLSLKCQNWSTISEQHGIFVFDVKWKHAKLLDLITHKITLDIFCNFANIFYFDCLDCQKIFNQIKFCCQLYIFLFRIEWLV